MMIKSPRPNRKAITPKWGPNPSIGNSRNQTSDPYRRNNRDLARALSESRIQLGDYMSEIMITRDKLIQTEMECRRYKDMLHDLKHGKRTFGELLEEESSNARNAWVSKVYQELRLVLEQNLGMHESAENSDRLRDGAGYNINAEVDAIVEKTLVNRISEALEVSLNYDSDDGMGVDQMLQKDSKSLKGRRSSLREKSSRRSSMVHFGTDAIANGAIANKENIRISVAPSAMDGAIQSTEVGNEVKNTKPVTQKPRKSNKDKLRGTSPKSKQNPRSSITDEHHDNTDSREHDANKPCSNTTIQSPDYSMFIADNATKNAADTKNDATTKNTTDTKNATHTKNAAYTKNLTDTKNEINAKNYSDSSVKNSEDASVTGKTSDGIPNDQDRNETNDNCTEGRSLRKRKPIRYTLPSLHAKMRRE